MYYYEPSFFKSNSQIKVFIESGSAHLFGGSFAIITICSIGNFIISVFYFIYGLCLSNIKRPWLSG